MYYVNLFIIELFGLQAYCYTFSYFAEFLQHPHVTLRLLLHYISFFDLQLSYLSDRCLWFLRFDSLLRIFTTYCTYRLVVIFVIQPYFYIGRWTCR